MCPIPSDRGAREILPRWWRIRPRRKLCCNGKQRAGCARSWQRRGTGWNGGRQLRGKANHRREKGSGRGNMANELAGKKVEFLGAGKMGGILLQALLKSGLLSAKSTWATVAHEERAKALAAKTKVKV